MIFLSMPLNSKIRHQDQDKQRLGSHSSLPRQGSVSSHDGGYGTGGPLADQEKESTDVW